MESKIQIDIAEDNQPVIIVAPKTSFDVRDKMVKRFTETLGHQSSWCTIEFQENGTFEIRPLAPSELKEQAKLMNDLAESN